MTVRVTMRMVVTTVGMRMRHENADQTLKTTAQNAALSLTYVIL